MQSESIRVLSVFFLTVFVLPLVSCTSMLYFPTDVKYVNEDKIFPKPKEVFVESSQDKEHMSWFFETTSKDPKPITVVFTHGNGQNKSAHFRILHWLAHRGINLFVVGYPGYGPNDGDPSPATTIEAARLGLDWVRKNRPDDSIFLVGQSLGGNVMLSALSEYSERDSICGVAIEGSFLSYQAVARETLARVWFLWPFQWLPYIVIDDSLAIAKRHQNLPKHLPYLIIHGDADEIVKISFGKELFEALPQNKVFWQVEGGRHINTFASHLEYRDKFIDFILKSCPVPSS